ncbi:hypothetical protein [Streptomyces sp. NBRC 109706]|uniref:hypothetical protein n=1 Tax=Streptomyces sp. NBRC 109706 TaxID=1550035 RepID=UPI0007821FE6|nr:hypothetical protein [Streptomyces sp. NBRC 109706]
MRYPRVAIAAVAAIGLVSALSGTASAATDEDTPQSCGPVELSGSLPVPPEGMSVQQTVTIGEDCEPELGPVEYVPAESPSADLASTAASRQIRSWNEMYDCCNIRMSGLYTTADWTTEDNRILTATTGATQEWNREPWNAGWNLESASDTQNCAEDCATVQHEAVADFSYQGIFDPIGNLYANSHQSSITLNPDTTATCTFDVQLRNTFIGWNWQRGCE